MDAARHWGHGPDDVEGHVEVGKLWHGVELLEGGDLVVIKLEVLECVGEAAQTLQRRGTTKSEVAS